MQHVHHVGLQYMCVCVFYFYMKFENEKKKVRHTLDQTGWTQVQEPKGPAFTEWRGLASPARTSGRLLEVREQLEGHLSPVPVARGRPGGSNPTVAALPRA